MGGGESRMGDLVFNVDSVSVLQDENVSQHFKRNPFRGEVLKGCSREDVPRKRSCLNMYRIIRESIRIVIFLKFPSGIKTQLKIEVIQACIWKGC